MLSFVIPAHNEETLLGRTLEQLRSSAVALGRRYELIVVADGCTDATADVARRAEARILEVDC
jgi:glycosyltransferase involved in cell wall biosynthesis